MRKIQVVTRTHSHAVNNLRLAEYAKAQGFTVGQEGILWNASDDQSLVLCAFDSDELVSTMRMEIIDDMELVEKKIECPWTFPLHLRLPVMILSRAATASTHRGTGINTLLRLRALEISKRLGVEFALGTFVADSPRARTLERMGYVFFENTLGWNQANFCSEGKVIVAALDLQTSFEKAIEECQRLTQPLLHDYEFIADLPHEGRVTVVK